MNTNGWLFLNFRQKVKVKSVQYKGGCCAICGYNRNISSLDFHHLDPLKKDFTISARSVSWDRNRQELDKCVLLCRNCHSEIHEVMRLFDLCDFNDVTGKISSISGDVWWPMEEIVEFKSQNRYFCSRCGNRVRRVDKVCSECLECVGFGPTLNNKCVDCGDQIWPKASRCVPCNRENVWKVNNWPDTEFLIKSINDFGYKRTAKEIGVSDNAVRNRLRFLGMDPKSIKWNRRKTK